MIKIRLIVFLILLTGSMLSVIAQPSHIKYEFHKQDSISLLMTLSFNLDQTGKAVLHLPSEWAGQRNLYQAISQLHAASTVTRLDTTAKPNEYTISGEPGKKVSISYLLKQDRHGPLRYPLYFRPVFRNGIFYFEGYSGLVYPDIAEEHRFRCSIVYTGFDNDEFTGNSFYSGIRRKTFTTTINNLLNSFFCAGRYRSKSVKINGNRLTMAVTGKFPFSDEVGFEGISRIVAEERNFWKSKGSKYFFTVLLPMDDHGNYGGTAHYQSFSLFQSPDLKVEDGFLPLVSHEYFHNWLGGELTMPEPSEVYKWFSEGFTDYYSLKLLWAASLISPETFIAKLNAKIRAYYLSPYFNKSNQDIVGKYWSDPQMRTLSYERGLTIAFLLDNQISEKGRVSLDNLMYELYHQRKQQQQPFKKAAFDRLILKYADSATLKIVDESNAGNNELLTQAIFALKNRNVSPVIVDKVFDLGFDQPASKAAKKIAGLKEHSNAAKAGLKEDMELTGEFSYYNNNPEKPAKVGTIQSGRKIMIEFMPSAQVNILIPQITK